MASCWSCVGMRNLWEVPWRVVCVDGAFCRSPLVLLIDANTYWGKLRLIEISHVAIYRTPVQRLNSKKSTVALLTKREKLE